MKTSVWIACLLATCVTISEALAEKVDASDLTPGTINAATISGCISGSSFRYLPTNPQQIAPSCNLPMSGHTSFACRSAVLEMRVLATGRVSIEVTSLEFDPVAYIYCPSFDLASNCVAFDDDGGAGVSSLIDIPAGLPVGYYFLYVFGFGPLDAGCYTVTPSNNVFVAAFQGPVAIESIDWGSLKSQYR
jgi:hypothetical protein